MKTIRISMLLMVSGVLATGILAQTQPHSHQQPAPKAATPKKQSPQKHGMMDNKMMAHCHQMMQKHTQMQADMKAMDDKLNGLVVSMNRANGSEKTDAIAAVLNEMVVQRKEMHEKMASMQTGMMQHMMEHMQHSGKTSMMQCPMMMSANGSKGMMGGMDHGKK